MNDAENDGGAKAIDSLLNYETVKVSVGVGGGQGDKAKVNTRTRNAASNSKRCLSLSLSFALCLSSTLATKRTRLNAMMQLLHATSKRLSRQQRGVFATPALTL